MREQVGPTVDQVQHVIALMPADSAIERRAPLCAGNRVASA